MKCKNCKKKIEYANFSADVESFGEVDFEREDYNIGYYGEWKNIIYSCPLCHYEGRIDYDNDYLKEIATSKNIKII